MTYGIMGLLVWLAFLQSGVHATLARVIMGLMTPARADLSESMFADTLKQAQQALTGGTWQTVVHRGERVERFRRVTHEIIARGEYLEGNLHPWVGFLIMPLFALANAGVTVDMSLVNSAISLAVVAGPFICKPVGIVLSSWIAIRARIGQLPEGVSWRLLAAEGVLGGIGFTMALLVSSLALPAELLDSAKVGVLIGSALSMLFGLILLRIFGTVGAASSKTDQ
jgi:Na+:H+ antiporter, NhaA family